MESRAKFFPGDVVVATVGRKKESAGVIVNRSEFSDDRYVVRWGKSSKSLQGYNGNNLRKWVEGDPKPPSITIGEGKTILLASNSLSTPSQLPSIDAQTNADANKNKIVSPLSISKNKDFDLRSESTSQQKSTKAFQPDSDDANAPPPPPRTDSNHALFQNKTEEEEGIDCLFDDVMKRALEKLDSKAITQAEFNQIQRTMSRSKLMVDIEPNCGDMNSKSVGHPISDNTHDLPAALNTNQVPKAVRNSDLTVITEEGFSSEELDCSDSSSDEFEGESAKESVSCLVEFCAALGRGETLVRDDKVDKICFKPAIKSLFPAESDLSKRLGIRPEAICEFCFPMGLELVGRPIPPRQFSAVLTDAAGTRYYLFVLQIFEPLTVVERRCLELTPEQEGMRKWLQDASATIYAPVAVCVVSRYPFVTAFSKFLKQLYRVSRSSAPVPIERYICNVCVETPLPPRGKVHVSVSMADCTLGFSRPPPNELPFCDPECFRILLQRLSVPNVMSIFKHMLMPGAQVAFCSCSLSLFTPVALAINSLLFPFQWIGMFISILPERLAETVLEAPVPFMIGIPIKVLRDHLDCIERAKHAQFAAISAEASKMVKTLSLGEQLSSDEGGESAPEDLEYDKYMQVLFVDLDSNVVHKPRAVDSAPMMPDRAWKKLQKSLEELGPKLQPGDSFEQRKLSVSLDAIEFDERKEIIKTFAIEAGVITKGLRNRTENRDISSILNKSSISMKSLARSKSGSNVVSGSDSKDREKSEDPDDAVIGEMRALFLRFFTTVMKTYRNFIVAQPENEDGSRQDRSQYIYPLRAEGNIDSKVPKRVFAVARFVDSFKDIREKGIRRFFEQLTQSQMFIAFMQERLVCPDSVTADTDIEEDSMCEKWFFDEHIVAKLNRSFSISFNSGKTPFLDESKWDIKDTFIVPLTSAGGLTPTQRYNYDRFPIQWRKERMGTPRRPRQLAMNEKRRLAQMSVQRSIQKRVSRLLRRSDRLQDYIIARSNKRMRKVKARKAVYKSTHALFRDTDRSITVIQKWWRALQEHIKNKNALQHRIMLFKKAQAMWRGYRCRVTQAERRGRLIEALRRRIFDLWHTLATPLLYRTVFWSAKGVNGLVVDGDDGPESQAMQPRWARRQLLYRPSASFLALHLDEHNILVHNHGQSKDIPQSAPGGEGRSMDADLVRLLELRRASLSPVAPFNLAKALQDLETERQWVKELLQEHGKSGKVSASTAADFSPSDALWVKFEQAEASAETMLTLLKKSCVGGQVSKCNRSHIQSTTGVNFEAPNRITLSSFEHLVHQAVYAVAKAAFRSL